MSLKRSVQALLLPTKGEPACGLQAVPGSPDSLSGDNVLSCEQRVNKRAAREWFLKYTILYIKNSHPFYRQMPVWLS